MVVLVWTFSHAYSGGFDLASSLAFRPNATNGGTYVDNSADP